MLSNIIFYTSMIYYELEDHFRVKKYTCIILYIKLIIKILVNIVYSSLLHVKTKQKYFSNITFLTK